MRRSDRTSGTCGSSRSPDRVQGPSSVPSWDLTSLSIGQPSPHDDRAAHRRAVHRAIVLIGARRRERDGVRLAVAAHDRAARERGRPLGLDAVRDALVVGPRPRHSAAHRYRVDRRVSGAVVGADEHDSPVVPYRHRPGRTAAAPTARAPPPPPPPPPLGARPPAPPRAGGRAGTTLCGGETSHPPPLPPPAAR